MKAILGVLLCYVFFTAQCFAIKGGPIYPGGSTSITGSYAGVLDPVSSRPNALGIFTAVIPQTGLASGQFLMFIEGRTFSGSLQGIGDPNKSLLRAVVQGIPIVTSGDTTVTTLGIHADGRITANVTRSTRSAFGVSNTLLVGTATIIVTTLGVAGPATKFVVDGFQQSTSTTASG